MYCLPTAIAISIASQLFLSPTFAHAKTIDLSTRTDPLGEFDLAFCSRPSPDSAKGWPGHAFVSFSWKRPNGDRDFTAIGHTVTPGTSVPAATWSLFGSPISGWLRDERYTAVLQNCLEVRVNKEDYDRAHALTQSPLQALGLSDLPQGFRTSR